MSTFTRRDFLTKGSMAGTMLAGAGALPAWRSITGARASSSKKKLTISMVTQSPNTDPFWIVVYNGLLSAGATFGVNVKYSGLSTQTYDVNEMRKIFEAAAAANPDAMVVSVLDTSIMSSVEAVAQKIPVVIVNTLAGYPPSTSVLDNSSCIAYVGNNEYQDGVYAAQQLMKLGATSAMCVTALPGQNVTLDGRANGFTDTFKGPVMKTDLSLQDTNSTTVVNSTVEAGLQKNSSINGVCSVNQQMTSAISSIDQSKYPGVHWGGLDPASDSLAALKAGKLKFLNWQQQFLQGFQPVQVLCMYLLNDIYPSPEKAVYQTGPRVLLPEDADAAIKTTTLHSTHNVIPL
jgi:simple sugar transport system substrate-binding protein